MGHGSLLKMLEKVKKQDIYQTGKGYVLTKIFELNMFDGHLNARLWFLKGREPIRRLNAPLPSPPPW